MGSRTNLNATSSLDIDYQLIENGAIALLKLNGTIDAKTFEILEAKIEEAFSGNIFRIVADMTHVREISSSGTGVIVGALSHVREQGGNLVLLGVSSAVHEIFDILDLLEQFPTATDLASAIQLVQTTTAPPQEVKVPDSGAHSTLSSVTRKPFEA